MKSELHGRSAAWGDNLDDNDSRTAESWARRRRLLFSVILIISLSTVLLSAGWALGRSQKRTLPTSVVPGEFERHDALLLSWPTDQIFPADLQAPQRDIVANIVEAVRENVSVLVLVPDEQNEVAAAERLCPNPELQREVQFLRAPNSLIWVRDYGPLVRKSFGGGTQLVDAIYPHEQFPEQDNVPKAVSDQLAIPLLHAPIRAQFGNLLSNGAGLCVATDKLIYENASLGYNEAKMTKVLEEYFGATKVVYLESLIGEPNGHADMFVTFPAVDIAIVGQYSSGYDRKNAAILDRNARRLAAVKTPAGPLRVHRIPMPERVADSWYTYTNVVYANGVLLLPSYGRRTREAEERAKQVYSGVLPGWKIVPIDCSRLILGKGALHCITMNFHTLPQPFLGQTRGNHRRRDLPTW